MAKFQNGLELNSGERIEFADLTTQDSAAYTQAENNLILGRRNYIQNADFSLWDYGTSQATGEYGFGCANRWFNHESNNCERTVSRQSFTIGQTDVEGNPRYYIRTIITDSGGGDGDFINMNQRIENVRTLSGQSATLSFYAKASSSLYLSTEFSQCFGDSGSAIVESIGVQKHTLSTSWQKFTKTVSIPSISGKTLNPDYDSYLKCRFFMSAGSDFNTQTDTLGFQTGTFDIAQVQVEPGSIVTPFEIISPAQNKSDCAYYYMPVLRVGGTIYTGATPVALRWSGSYRKMQRQPIATVTEVTASNLSSFDTVANEANGYIEIQGTTTSTGMIVARADVELDAELPSYT